MEFIYGTSTYDRTRGNLPYLPVVNMFAETAPTEPKATLQSRPGLEASGIEMGAGAVRSLYKLEGFFSNQVFGVSGTTLYGNSSAIGTITGSGHVSMASYENVLFINAGAVIHVYDGTLTSIAFPDTADVTKIVIGASRLIAIRKDTGKFYWSSALGTTIAALDFATAENSPDKLLDALFIGDTLILFGTDTVEFWPASDDAAAPFNPMIGRTFPVGIRETGAATRFNNSFAWVTSDNRICMGDPDNIISDLWLQELIEASPSARLWTFQLDGEEVLALRLSGSTYAMPARSKQWSELRTYGKTNFLPQCFADGYFGSGVDGKLLQWSDSYTDLGDRLERSFRAWSPITQGGVSIFSMNLRANPGRTTVLSGTYSNPVVEMRTSRDGGEIFSLWRARSLGTSAGYRTQVRWYGLGTFGFPGVMAEFRVTDPVTFRVSDLTINEPQGGR